MLATVRNNFPIFRRHWFGTMATAPTALIPVANGSEEIETVCMQDVMVRGGIKVTLASVGGNGEKVVKMSRGLMVQADVTIEECANKTFDLIVLPGGMPGATHLRDSSVLIDMLRRQKESGKWYGAICASPAVVLHHHQLLAGLATSYPSFEDKMPGAEYSHERVVVSSNCVTSRGPGTAMDMGLKLVELLTDKKTAAAVADGLLVPLP
ncbi:Aste57867_23633 [Aphanomyces stellatus]|uniref:Aste57867_23633 protein n=1 Tax=Aphanomyces stellatus TaxID=120398 RepID=A0A485LN71_9STRA|nr:hypothetical protein As57867_023561 [Aphanomyces stellatus]VFU00278.1 Aste57867_23633 [Aphanomyces stellatus]